MQYQRPADGWRLVRILFIGLYDRHGWVILQHVFILWDSVDNRCGATYWLVFVEPWAALSTHRRSSRANDRGSHAWRRQTTDVPLATQLSCFAVLASRASPARVILRADSLSLVRLGCLTSTRCVVIANSRLCLLPGLSYVTTIRSVGPTGWRCAKCELFFVLSFV